MRTVLVVAVLAWGLAAQAADGSLLSARARASFDGKNFDPCVLEMDARIGAHPSDAAALLERGWCLLGSAYDSNAWERLRDTIAMATDLDREGLDRAADTDFDARRVRAMEDASAVLRLDPTNSSAYALRGLTRHLMLRKGNVTTVADLDATMDDLDAAIRLDPSRVDVHRARGKELLFRGAHARAEADFAVVVKASPDDGMAEVWRGEAAAGRVSTDEARRACLAAAVRVACAPVLEAYALDHPESAIAQLELARALDSWPRGSTLEESAAIWDRARQAYLRAIALAPGDLVPYQELVELLLVRAGDPNGAFAVADKAVAALPKRSEAWILRARTFLVAGEVDRARSDVDRAIALDPRSSAAHVVRGDVLAQQRDAAGALAAYDTAIGLDPDNGRAHLQRGVLATAQKDLAGALAALSGAVRLGVPCAKSYRGNVHVLVGLSSGETHGTGSFSAASRDFLEDDATVCPVTHYLYAQALFAQGQFSEALERGQLALERFGRTSEVSPSERATLATVMQLSREGVAARAPTPSSASGGSAQRVLDDYHARYAAIGMRLVATGVYDYSVGIDPRMRVTIERVGFSQADTFVAVGVKQDGSRFGLDVMLDDRFMARPTGDGLSVDGDYGMSVDIEEEGSSSVVVAQVLLTAKTGVRAMGFSPRGGGTSDVYWAIFHKKGE